MRLRLRRKRLPALALHRDYDPRYPLAGFRVLDFDGVVRAKSVHENCVRIRDASGDVIVSAHRHGSFFALKPGEKGTHGVVGE